MKKIIITMIVLVSMININVSVATNEVKNEEKPIPVLYDGEKLIPTLYNGNVNIYYNEDLLKVDMLVKEQNDITMIQLRPILENAGYKIKWNKDNKSIEIMKNSFWTSINIGSNNYFRNKMAPWELSCAPVIIENKSYVPIEFLSDIIGLSIQIKDRNIYLAEDELSTQEGFIQEISKNKDDKIESITISNNKESKGIEDQTILLVSEDTIIQGSIEKGQRIKAITKMIMTMSLPGQTPAIVIY